MKKFDANGYLSPGMHPHTNQTLHEEFVTAFGSKAHRRQKIFGSYNETVSVLQNANIFPLQWVGGTFVTNKPEPGDIDLVNICEKEQLENIPAELEPQIAQIFSTSHGDDRKLCDCYLVIKGMEKHPKNKQFKTIYEYWQNQFGFDDCGIPKGIATIQVARPPTPKKNKGNVQ